MDAQRDHRIHRSGYQLHPIQVKLASRDWASWEDAIAVELNEQGHILIVEYLDGRRCRLWRHPSDFNCPIGSPVRVSERWQVLAMGARWLSVDALDPKPRAQRPAPIGPEYNGPPGPRVIVDLSAGEGLDIDHPDENASS